MVDVTPTAQQPTTGDIDSLMRKVEARSRKSAGWLFVSVILILAAVVIGVVGIYKQTAISKSIQATQDAQVASTVEARKANAARQQQLADYIKCLSVARFDHPEILKPTVTKEQVVKILDDCAKEQ